MAVVKGLVSDPYQLQKELTKAQTEGPTYSPPSNCSY